VSLCALMLAAVSAAGAGAATSASFVPGEVIVRYAAGSGATARKAAIAARKGRVARELRLAHTVVVELPAGTSVAAAAKALTADPAVEYAEPNYLYRIASTPNDPLFPRLWGLHQASDADIDAPEAWVLTTGSQSVVVAVIDTGVAYGHPDLAPNIWINPREIAGNGLDDDGNGRVDDVHGWDSVSRDNQPLDEHGHGTHVAGTIGARGNDAYGVAGVNWRVQLMALRAGDATGAFPLDAIADSIAYACANGARVVNGSFGGPWISKAITSAMQSAACAQTLFVFAAGNESLNNDTTASFPCNAAVASIVCVAATTASDALAAYSNYGVQNVDLAAPGSAILSTTLSEHRTLNGTSMATPHVAGVAGLMLARNATLTPAELRATILASVDPLPGLAGRVVTGGRLNARNAVAAVPVSGPSPSTESETQPSAPAQESAPVAAPAPAPAPAVTPAPAPAPVCIVPRLRGKTLAAAKNALRSRNCSLGRVTRAHSSVVRKGRVLRQSKPAGTRLKAGTKIAVAASLGRRS
jgi:subtilisin family serine protease